MVRIQMGNFRKRLCHILQVVATGHPLNLGESLSETPPSAEEMEKTHGKIIEIIRKYWEIRKSEDVGQKPETEILEVLR